MKNLSGFAARQARRLLAPLVLSMTCMAPSMAMPVLSATPGNASVVFNVAGVHALQTGAFTDTYAFKLGSDASLRSVALYASADIGNFLAQLFDDAGLVATGTSALSGSAQDDAFVDTIFLPNLAGGKEYQLRVSGIDPWGDYGSPYSLSVRVGPASVPEPSTLALAGFAAFLLLTRAGRRSRSQLPG